MEYTFETNAYQTVIVVATFFCFDDMILRRRPVHCCRRVNYKHSSSLLLLLHNTNWQKWTTERKHAWKHKSKGTVL